MRRVWDAFLFCDELDLLEARLTELEDAVYRHVLVEAPVTFQGTPKPLHYLENQARFAPWKDKIVHVTADLDSCQEPRPREYASREAIWQGLGTFGSDDIFLLSDADEIPRADLLQDARNCVLAMRNHVFAVNLVDLGWWRGTIATVGRPPCTMQQLREMRLSPDAPALRDAMGCVEVAGWHFSWLGGPDGIGTKVTSYTAPEEAVHITTDPERMYREKTGIPGLHLLEVVMDGSWPRYMREHRGPASWYWPGQ
jgi:Glycosyltransferase family 17